MLVLLAELVQQIATDHLPALRLVRSTECLLWVHRYRSEFVVHNRSEFVDLLHDTKSIMLNYYNGNRSRTESRSLVEDNSKAKKITERCERVHA